MNEVEKQVHKLLFENKMSIWLKNGAGGVKLDKDGKIHKFSLSIFTDPVRASVLPPRIHANCLTDETFLIYDDGILCFHPAEHSSLEVITIYLLETQGQLIRSDHNLSFRKTLRDPFY
jgi:hypothetical protein